MTSLIKNAASLGITYSASSLSQYFSYKPENVFEDSDSLYFQSASSPSDQWWQVSFSKQVAISSYIIRTGADYGARPTAWRINASNDNVIWKTVHTVTGTDVGGNTAKFYPYSTVHCRYFRIVLDKSTWSDSTLAFSFFDCFGELSPSPTNKVNCYCNAGKDQKRAQFGIKLNLF